MRAGASPLHGESELRDSGWMKTPDGHEIYWERRGKRGGAPAVFLHGGPGSGMSAWHACTLDPKKYDIVTFDQRGAGKSRPHASLKNNTTPHLVADMEQLRKKFGLEKWLICGGSWGSTLALAYADKYPKRVSALVVWGVFLARQEELEFLYYPGGTVSRIFPEVFEPYLALLPKAARKNPIKGYNALFRAKNRALRLKAVDVWTRLESSVLRLITTEENLKASMDDPEYVLAHSLLENHYFMKKGFIDGDKILKGIGAKLRSVPVHIIQGRYDMVTPFLTAWELHKAVKHSRLHVIPDAGHHGREPGITRKLVEILDGL
jgi:proline iminopeptidase